MPYQADPLPGGSAIACTKLAAWNGRKSVCFTVMSLLFEYKARRELLWDAQKELRLIQTGHPRSKGWRCVPVHVTSEEGIALNPNK